MIDFKNKIIQTSYKDFHDTFTSVMESRIKALPKFQDYATTISNDMPEAGGGGASAEAVTGEAPSASSDDDGGDGDGDPDPARRKRHLLAPMQY